MIGDRCLFLLSLVLYCDAPAVAILSMVVGLPVMVAVV